MKGVKPELDLLLYQNEKLLKAANADPRVQALVKSLLPPLFQENEKRIKELEYELELNRLEKLMQKKYKPASNWNDEVRMAAKSLESVIISNDRYIKAENAELKRYLFRCTRATFIDKETMEIKSPTVYVLVDNNWKDGKRVGVQFFYDIKPGTQIKQDLLEDMHRWVMGGELPKLPR